MTPVTIEQALDAIGIGTAIHTLQVESAGHLSVSVMQREVFLTLIKMPTCKLSLAEPQYCEMRYPLRVETSQRVFYVFCNSPLSSE